MDVCMDKTQKYWMGLNKIYNRIYNQQVRWSSNTMTHESFAIKMLSKNVWIKSTNSYELNQIESYQIKSIAILILFLEQASLWLWQHYDYMDRL